MNISQLDLLILEQEGKLYFWDTSVYNKDISITNSIYRISPPNFSTQYQVDYIPNQLLVLTPDLFGFQSFPDGAWKVEQSICPNETMCNTVYYYKVSDLKTKLLKTANDLLNCNTSSAADSILRSINRLEIVKYLLEFCKDISKANIIYNEINESNTDCNC